MPDLVTVAQAELRAASRSLLRLRMHLLGVIAGLDAPAASEQEETPDLEMASEMRRTVQSVLSDFIDPAIDDLANASRYRPAGEAAAEPEEGR
jgi:hypothetical protein